MKIAVVGSGISGMGAALALSEVHEVHLFEKESRFGGHANTVEVAFGDRQVPVDTGFIVYNYKNYPNLTGLFDHLRVETKWSDMSFGVSVDGGRMEYGCGGLNELFVQRSNLFRPRFVRGLRDILRFNRDARAHLESGALEGMSLGGFIETYGYSDWFRDNFALAMGGAIWSTPTARMLDFPAANFVRFFDNHELMEGLNDSQRWRTVAGGSREYVQRLTAKLPFATANAGVAEVARLGGKVELRFNDGSAARFDAVVLACHAPDALGMLQTPDAQERSILGKFGVSKNLAVLHSDPALMPKRQKIWSSWNFLSPADPATDGRPAPVTYWMNRLQGIDRRYPLFVSLNPGHTPAEHLTHGCFAYNHPLYDADTFEGQATLGQIQGRGGVWYAGAWAGFGFHEDGLTAGLRVAASLGATPAWALGQPEAYGALAEAA